MDSFTIGAFVSFLICIPVSFVLGLFFELRLKDNFGILSFFLLVGIMIAATSTFTSMPNLIHQIRFQENYFEEYHNVYLYHSNGRIQHRYTMKLHKPLILHFELEVDSHFDMYMDHSFEGKSFEELFTGFDDEQFGLYEHRVNLKKSEDYEFELNGITMPFDSFKNYKLQNGDSIKIIKN